MYSITTYICIPCTNVVGTSICFPASPVATSTLKMLFKYQQNPIRCWYLTSIFNNLYCYIYSSYWTTYFNKLIMWRIVHCFIVGYLNIKEVEFSCMDTWLSYKTACVSIRDVSRVDFVHYTYNSCSVHYASLQGKIKLC